MIRLFFAVYFLCCTFFTVRSKPLAVIYTGPAACLDCPDAVAKSLAGSNYDFVFATGENVTNALQSAAVYIQPGGGDSMEVGWNGVKGFAINLQKWIAAGGHYVGICMGGYLAGTQPGFDLLGDGESHGYMDSPSADIKNMSDFLITLKWRGVEKKLFFQGGPSFILPSNRNGVQVLATYSNNDIAAMVVPYGKGSVGVVGPHPEAPQDWFQKIGGTASPDLFLDLVNAAVNVGQPRLRSVRVQSHK